MHSARKVSNLAVAVAVVQIISEHVDLCLEHSTRVLFTLATRQAGRRAGGNETRTQRSTRTLAHLVLSARILAKAAMQSGVMDASVPPHTITSASPSRTKRNASPTACSPVVHAVVAARFGPCEHVNTAVHH